MKYIALPFLFLLSYSICGAQVAQTENPEPAREPIYLNTSYSFEERAADLISRFTLEEKQSLIGNSMPAIPRLGIRSYNVWNEALHGVLAGANPDAGLEGPTSFPNSVALGSTWDPELIKRVASAISDEARAFHSNEGKGLTYWSPVVEPVRDPRWGRTGESYGEDPYLVSEMASGFINGLMGDDPDYLKAVPSAKHYLANNSEFDRHVSSSDMDSRDMREFYLSPYKNLIENDNLPSIMSSYNAVNGVPTSASPFLLDTLARRTYGMEGYITGDCASILDIYTGHFYMETAEEATAEGLKAGVDIDCGDVYQQSAIDALNQGLITVADIDRALLHIFTIRMRTGEFDSPASPYTQVQPNMVNSPFNQALAKEVATKTPVLLKNNAASKTNTQALPLFPDKINKIALLGPQAEEVELGPYSGRPEQANIITPVAGIENYLRENGYETEMVHSSGANTTSKSNLLYIARFELQKSDGSVTEYDATNFSDASEGITVGSGMGEVEQVRTIDDGSWTAYENIDLTDVDSMAVMVNIPTEGGVIEIRVGSTDGNLIGTLEATAASGKPVGGVYGEGTMMKIKVNKLGVTEPQTLYFSYHAPNDAEIDDATIEAAKEADVAVVFVGTDENTATEEADRLTLVLPGNQVELIKKVAEVNPYTIVVMQTLGMVEVEEFKHLNNIPGIIWVGYNGQAQGDAIAQILFGEANPGGKLNASWFKSVNDLPPITDYTLRGGPDKNGRTLWYFDKELSYEFGYGLSYTTFEYDNFDISKSSITPHDTFTISVDVTNTGSYDGDEVVQVYMKTPDSPAELERPIKRLKGFQRVTIPVGQTETVNIDIDAADLWFWDMEEDKMTYDKGTYVFEIGASSEDIKGTVRTEMKGDFVPEIKTVVTRAPETVLEQGDRTQTSVTAAMTDDSFYDIDKATVIYSSNNPSVATVDENGKVTAQGTGIATIFASVTINGITKSDGFPVKVMPNLNLASVTVNKKAIPDFSNERTQYSYLMNKASATAPKVEVKPAVSSVSVEVTQAKGVPGTAVISVTDYITLDKKEYAINFGIPSESDDFESNSLGDQWIFLQKNSDNWSLSEESGSLLITAEKGDIAEANEDAKNILLQSANSDWTMETKLTYSRKPASITEETGLIAYQDNDNYVKLTFGGTFGRMGSARQVPGIVELSVESVGYQTASVNLNLEDFTIKDNTVYLRLAKNGDIYTAFFSADGEEFTEVGEVGVVLKDIRAGLMAIDGELPARFARWRRFMQRNEGPSAPFEVAFDYFRIENSGIKQ